MTRSARSTPSALTVDRITAQPTSASAHASKMPSPNGVATDERELGPDVVDEPIAIVDELALVGPDDSQAGRGRVGGKEALEVAPSECCPLARRDRSQLLGPLQRFRVTHVTP